MTIKPSVNRRNVFLDIETIAIDPADPQGALSGLAGRLVCVAALADDGQNIQESIFIDEDEAAILRSFWSFVRPKDVFIGHNVLNFDLMFLRQRSWINGVRPSRRTDLRRYYSNDVIDTQQVFSNWGMAKYPSLNELAAALGCGVKLGNGADVAGWWAAKDFDRIATYCRQDVIVTLKVFHRLMFRPLPDRFCRMENDLPLASILLKSSTYLLEKITA